MKTQLHAQTPKTTTDRVRVGGGGKFCWLVAGRISIGWIWLRKTRDRGIEERGLVDCRIACRRLVVRKMGIPGKRRDRRFGLIECATGACNRRRRLWDGREIGEMGAGRIVAVGARLGRQWRSAACAVGVVSLIGGKGLRPKILLLAHQPHRSPGALQSFARTKILSAAARAGIPFDG